jgi:hypothetical protein
LIFPMHQNVLSGGRKLTPQLKYGYLLMIMSTLIFILNSMLLAPWAYMEKRDWDHFVASSQIAQATFTECFTSSLLGNKVATFTYFPDPQTEITGDTVYWGSCDRYPVGTPVMIRYSLSEPDNAEILNHIDLETAGRYLFYVVVFTFSVSLFNLAVFIWLFYRILRLERSGRVQRGQIVSLKPIWWLMLPHALLRYEITTGDGSIVTGKQIITRRQAAGLTPGMPIAVLYASPKNYFAL